MSDERRNRILDACTVLLLKYGYDKTTVSDIAAQAGISKGAIYLHFPSKEALVEALIWREMEVAQYQIAERIRADPDGGSFFSLYLHALRVAIDMPLLRALYANRKHVFGDALTHLAPKFASARNIDDATAFIKQYQALGLIRPELDAHIVSFIMAFIRYGLIVIDEVIPSAQIPPMEDVLVMLAGVLHRGFGTDGGDTQAGRETFVTFMRDAVERGKSGSEPDKEG